MTMFAIQFLRWMYLIPKPSILVSLIVKRTACIDYKLDSIYCENLQIFSKPQLHNKL